MHAALLCFHSSLCYLICIVDVSIAIFPPHFLLAQDVIVVTGPAYLPTWSKEHGYVLSIKTVGSLANLVHVPTHFFKIILTRKVLSTSIDGDAERICCAAFLIPNIDVDADDVVMDGRPAPAGLVSYWRDLCTRYIGGPIWSGIAACLRSCGCSSPPPRAAKVVSRDASDSGRGASSISHFVIKIEDLVLTAVRNEVYDVTTI
jgi:hypothetical protein